MQIAICEVRICTFNLVFYGLRVIVGRTNSDMHLCTCGILPEYQYIYIVNFFVLVYFLIFF